MNLCTKNTSELKVLLKDIDKTDIECQKTGLEIILSTFASKKIHTKLNEIGLILDKRRLFFTMDFNFDSCITHALNYDSYLSVDILL